MNRRTLLKSSLALLPAAQAGHLMAFASDSPASSSRGGPYRIFVTFAWSFINIGDIGITPGLLHLLQKHIPGCEVTLVCNSAFSKYQEYLKPRFPNVQILPTPFNSAEPRSKEFTDAFNAADMLLYQSGTTLTYGRWDRDWNRTMPFVLSPILARNSKKPYGIYGDSFEAIAPPSDVLLVPVLSDANFLFTRETKSLGYLKQLGVRSRTMGFTPDSTFGFDLRDEAWADQFLQRMQLERGKFITVVNRSKIQGFLDDQRDRAHAEKLRYLIVQYVEKTGENVLIMPEVRDEIGPNRSLLYDPLPPKIKKNVRWMDEFWFPEQAFSVLARARTHVSVDMHSVIMALVGGTPVVYCPFAECGSKSHMLVDLGVPEWLFDIDKDSAEQIAGELSNIVQNYPAARSKVEVLQSRVASLQAESMGVVRQTIEDARRSG